MQVGARLDEAGRAAAGDAVEKRHQPAGVADGLAEPHNGLRAPALAQRRSVAPGPGEPVLGADGSVHVGRGEEDEGEGGTRRRREHLAVLDAVDIVEAEPRRDAETAGQRREDVGVVFERNKRFLARGRHVHSLSHHARLWPTEIRVTCVLQRRISRRAWLSQQTMLVETDLLA